MENMVREKVLEERKPESEEIKDRKYEVKLKRFNYLIREHGWKSICHAHISRITTCKIL